MNYLISRTEEYPKGPKSVAMLLSGGVDSSVAMYLLKEQVFNLYFDLAYSFSNSFLFINLCDGQGYDVEAFYLKIWLENEGSFVAECPWKEDISYCEETCKLLGVPLHVIPLQKEYKETILQYTLREAKRGRTPNPDVN